MFCEIMAEVSLTHRRVRYWHLADIQVASALSAFEPNRTFGSRFLIAVSPSSPNRADKPAILWQPVTPARFLPLFGLASASSNCTIFGIAPN
jgi:hypothetical protein